MTLALVTAALLLLLLGTHYVLMTTQGMWIQLMVPATLLLAGDKLIILDESGMLVLAKPTPGGLEIGVLVNYFHMPALSQGVGDGRIDHVGHFLKFLIAQGAAGEIGNDKTIFILYIPRNAQSVTYY